MAIDRDIGTRLRAASLVRDDEDLTVLHDRWLFVQAVRGYRFGIDAVVLARYALTLLSEGSAARVLDIGAGCGVVGILVAGQRPVSVTAVEIQPAQADRTTRNAALNGLSDRVSIVESGIVDAVARMPAGQFDLILSNPPFYRAGTGRVNPDGERAIARHEISLNMADLVGAVSHALSPSGRAVILYPAERLDECLAQTAARQLVPVNVVPLLPGPDLPAESFLVDLAHRSSGVTAASGPTAPMYLARDL